MNIPVRVRIQDLWGVQEFSKSKWGAVNYLVGPNGSGKTRFAEPLRQALSTAGMKPRYLSAERLAGWRNPLYGDSRVPCTEDLMWVSTRGRWIPKTEDSENSCGRRV